jgi:selenocysteine lyase/cysteine desulfurase
MAWGLAFNGIKFQQGDEIITSEMEYVTNILGFLNAEQTYGIQIKVIPNDDLGNFSLQALENAITSKTKLIAITQIASTAGTVVPVVEIGKIARRHNILYLVDACQTVGQIPINVKEIGCDILSATGRKYLRGPRGTGFLYVRKEIQDDLKIIFMDGHTAHLINENAFEIRKDARRFELFERNRALTLGLGKAIEYALDIGMGRIWQRVQYLAATMRRQLAEIDGVDIHDHGEQKSGIVTFSVSGIGSSHVKKELAEKKINVSVGLAESTLIYMNRNSLTTVVRASVHYYNTEEEIDALCNALEYIVKSDSRMAHARR